MSHATETTLVSNMGEHPCPDALGTH